MKQRKNIIVYLAISIMLITLLMTCVIIIDKTHGKVKDVPETYYPNSITDTVESPNTSISSNSAIYTILTQVPDIATIQDIRITYYTMFLIMEDGSEYAVYTDMEGYITAIYEWDPITRATGQEIYKLSE